MVIEIGQSCRWHDIEMWTGKATWGNDWTSQRVFLFSFFSSWCKFFHPSGRRGGHAWSTCWPKACGKWFKQKVMVASLLGITKSSWPYFRMVFLLRFSYIFLNMVLATSIIKKRSELFRVAIFCWPWWIVHHVLLPLTDFIHSSSKPYPNYFGGLTASSISPFQSLPGQILT